MEQKDKELLLKDLCGRLPYRVYVQVVNRVGYTHIRELTPENIQKMWSYKSIKPYLRPLSNMTEEEKKELEDKGLAWDMNCGHFCFLEDQDLYDWFDANHFDYRGLIDKSLAIEVIENNNPYKK